MFVISGNYIKKSCMRLRMQIHLSKRNNIINKIIILSIKEITSNEDVRGKIYNKFTFMYFIYFILKL